MHLLAASAVVATALFAGSSWCDEEPQPGQEYSEDVNDTGKDTVVAARATIPPQIDARLNDDCWKDATRLIAFRVASQPGQGLLARRQTEVLVTSDRKALYFAFVCHDGEPARIAAHQTQYDGAFDLDDFVRVSLDTLCDKTRCYQFEVNPLGTRRDVRWSDERWNASWQAAAKIGENGWTVEIAIPFSILVTAKGADRFGFNCGRYLVRDQEWSIWKYTRNYSDREFTWAELSGFEIGEEKRPDRYLGYVVGSRRFDEPASTAAHMGLDWEHPITNTTTGMLTLNPDWSNVEAAHAGIDFTYVERSFREVRPFFVESYHYLPTSTLFYPARRIYRFDEGLKLTGTEGRLRFGMLGMRGVERFADVPREDDLVGRLWYDFSHETYLNLMNVRTGNDNSSALEFVHERKARIRTRTNLAYYHQSSDEPGLGGSLSHASFNADTEEWGVQLGYDNIGDNLDPQLGRLSRRGLRTLELGGERYFNPKPGAAWFEKGDVGFTYARAINHDGTLNYEESAARMSARQSPRLSFDLSGTLYRHPSPAGEPFRDLTWSALARLFEREPTNASVTATMGTIEESRYRYLILEGNARTADDRLAGSVSLEWTGWGRRNARSLHSSEENAHQYGLWLTYRTGRNTWFSLSQRWLKQGPDTTSIFNAIVRKQYGVDHDLYIIFGNPQNPNETVKQVMVKYVMPFDAWGER